MLVFGGKDTTFFDNNTFFRFFGSLGSETHNLRVDGSLSLC